MKSGIKVIGEIKEYIDGRLINHQRNSIKTQFLGHLADAIRHTGTAPALGEANGLFNTEEIRNDGSIDYSTHGNGGIIIKDNNYSTNPWFTMETTLNDINYQGDTGCQWKGLITSDEDRSIVHLGIVNFLLNGDTPADSGGWWAEIDKSVSPLSLSTNQVYEVLWGIYFT